MKQFRSSQGIRPSAGAFHRKASQFHRYVAISLHLFEKWYVNSLVSMLNKTFKMTVTNQNRFESQLTGKDIANSRILPLQSVFWGAFLAILQSLLFTTMASAQPNCQPLPVPESVTASPESLLDYYSERSEDPLKLRIAADLNVLLSDRRNDDYHKAHLEVISADGLATAWDARIKLRGRFRRMTCDFPPLKIDLDKDDLRERGFAPFDQFKLVTHCMDDEVSQQLVLREYLAYALYSELTHQSFRVRLVEVTYTDQSGTYDDVTRSGFLIEDIDELAFRLDAEELELMNLPEESFDPYQRMMQSLFQFMVANADWDLVMARNVKFVKEAYSGKVLAVPYDFDFSGLVDAPYAIPNPNIGLGSVTDRVFRGPKERPEVVRQTIAHFNSKKEELLRVIDELEQLDRTSRVHARKMIQTFYRIVSNELLVNRLFVAEQIDADDKLPAVH